MMRILLLFITIATSTDASPLTEAVSDAVLRIAFSILDRDGDDVFSLEELRTALKPLKPALDWTDEDIKYFFDSLDKKKDGKLSYEDFESDINSALKDGFQYVLSSVDKNSNNKIGLNEIKTLENERLEGMLHSYHSRRGHRFNRFDMSYDYESYRGDYESYRGDDGEGWIEFVAPALHKEFEKAIEDVWSKLIKRLDKNDDNQISLDEIEDIVKDSIQMALHAVDRDGDDKVSLEELKHIANPDTLPETLISLFDENSDGELSYEEFKQVGDLDVINTVTQALERLGGGGGMSIGAVAAIVIVSLLLFVVGGAVAGYFIYKKKKDTSGREQFS